MDLIRLLEVGGHLREQLIGADAHINGKTQPGLDFILQLRSHVHRIIRLTAQRHIDEALIDAELLQYGRISAADGNEALRALFVPLPIASHDDQLRTGAKRHRHRRCHLHPQLLGRNGRSRNDTAAVRWVTRHHGRNLPDVLLAFTHHFHRHPRDEGGVNIDMENDAGHGLLVNLKSIGLFAETTF